MGKEMRRQSSPTDGGKWLNPVLVGAVVVLAGGSAALLRFFGGDTLLAAPATPLLLALFVIALGAAAAYYLYRRHMSGVPAASEPKRSVLAGLAGRQAFHERLGRHMDEHLEAGRQLAIHLVDLDGFADLNERLGERAGTVFLESAAEHLVALVQDPDCLARIGDDEFAIIQRETGGARHAEIYAKRIQDALRTASNQSPDGARASASIGVAVLPEHGRDAEQLLRSASIALRSVKQAGGDGFRLYAPSLERAEEARPELERAVADGLEKGWFELHFQPQYNLRSRRLTGFEALLRLNHPELGEQLPAAFLPVAEKSGLIRPLGEWVIGQALTVASEWPRHLSLSINISGAELSGGDAVATIFQQLSRFSFAANRLHVEISEAVLLDGSPLIDDQLRALRAAGVIVVLDDFGVGTSRLRALSGSVCDAIKLDCALVRRIGQDARMDGVIRGLIGTARAFDLLVFAEGVEKPEQAVFLMSHACQDVQGYLFGKPGPVRELGATIAKDLRNAVAGESAAPVPADVHSAAIAANRMSR